MTDPVQKYLPPEATMPKRGGREITLKDLATQTSGLPRLPSNLAPRDPADPYADYPVAQLYQFLSTYTLTRDIGAKHEYSNLGGGLLGHVLARRAGTTYEDLVVSRITKPLGMNSTVVTVPAAMRSRFAAGHDAQLHTVPYWSLPTLTGAGAIRSPIDAQGERGGPSPATTGLRAPEESAERGDDGVSRRTRIVPGDRLAGSGAFRR